MHLLRRCLPPAFRFANLGTIPRGKRRSRMLLRLSANTCGAISILGAFSLVTVIGISALAVEFGHALLQRTENQANSRSRRLWWRARLQFHGVEHFGQR